MGGANGTLSLATNGTAYSKLAQAPANTILGNPTGVTGNIQAFATSSLGVALSDTTGILSTSRGGTGVNTSAYSGTLGINNGTYYQSATTTAGTGLSYSAGAFTNTGVLSNVAGTGIGVSGATGNVTISNTGVLSVGPTGQTQTGNVGIGTTTSSFNGVTVGTTIVGSGSNLQFTPTLSGVLTEAGGGTHQSTYATGDMLYASAANTLSKLAIGTPGYVLGVSNGLPAWVATTTLATISGILSPAHGGTGQDTSAYSGTLGINNGTYYQSATTTAGTGLSYSAGAFTNTGVLSNVAGTGIGVSGATGNVTISNTGLLSLQQLGGGTAQTGAITFATTTLTLNGQTHGIAITNSGAAFTFTPTLSGLLGVGGGGTGLSSIASSSLLIGGPGNTFIGYATSSLGVALSDTTGIHSNLEEAPRPPPFTTAA